MKLIVGCPVMRREWIIARWFEHLHVALKDAGIEHEDVTTLFIGDYEGDKTFRVIDKTCLEMSFNRTVIDQPGTVQQKYRRVWGRARYETMVNLRNRLLESVREASPDFYWSLDSDILVAPTTLTSALQAIETGFDAVSSRCYMSPPPHTYHPSYAQWNPAAGLYRPDKTGLIKADVIMAAKLMTPKAYAVDYQNHREGEDTGWSFAARKAGCRLGYDGRVVSKHVMSEVYLDSLDQRCGF